MRSHTGLQGRQSCLHFCKDAIKSCRKHLVIKASASSEPTRITNNEKPFIYGGRCTRCGGEHFLAATSACVDAAQTLAEHLDTYKRFDYGLPLELADPAFSTDYVWTKGPGRMLGVLLCVNERTQEEVVLKAFSGQMTRRWDCHGWAGPVASITHTSPVYVQYRQAIEALTTALEQLHIAPGTLPMQPLVTVPGSPASPTAGPAHAAAAAAAAVAAAAAPAHSSDIPSAAAPAHGPVTGPACSPGASFGAATAAGGGGRGAGKVRTGAGEGGGFKSQGGSKANRMDATHGLACGPDAVTGAGADSRSGARAVDGSGAGAGAGAGGGAACSWAFAEQQQRLLGTRRALSRELLSKVLRSYNTRDVRGRSLTLLDVCSAWRAGQAAAVGQAEPERKVVGRLNEGSSEGQEDCVPTSMAVMAAGTGDCAAIKLLHAAASDPELVPLGLLEFWYGAPIRKGLARKPLLQQQQQQQQLGVRKSRRRLREEARTAERRSGGEQQQPSRQHGHVYGACGKCQQVLGTMLCPN